MTSFSTIDKPNPAHADYRLGYAAGQANTKLDGPWIETWRFKPPIAGVQWGFGHQQALHDQQWQPKSPHNLALNSDGFAVSAIHETSSDRNLYGTYLLSIANCREIMTSSFS